MLAAIMHVLYIIMDDCASHQEKIYNKIIINKWNWEANWYLLPLHPCPGSHPVLFGD